jgi:hypothetical protein
MTNLLDLGYTTEKEFVDEALQNNNKREILRKFVRPVAKRVAGHFTMSYPRFKAEELTQIGMRTFDSALNYFAKRWGSASNAPYKFTTYFSWWIARGIENYIHGGEKATSEEDFE